MVKAITSPRDVQYWWREERKACRFDFRAARLSNLKDLLKPIFTAKPDGVAVAKILVEEFPRSMWDARSGRK